MRKLFLVVVLLLAVFVFLNAYASSSDTPALSQVPANSLTVN